MKPLEFSQPASLDEALRLLSGNGQAVGLLAGGTDLIIQHRAGRREIGHMIDVKRIPDLNVLELDGAQGLRLGAAVSCGRITDHADLLRTYPALAEGAELIGSTQIQSRATVGGNLCNGSPAADSVCSLIVLDAQCIVASTGNQRSVPARDFMTGPGTTVLAPGELLVEVRVPAPAPRSSSAYLRFIPRNEMDIAVASAAVALTLGEDGRTVERASVAIGAVGPTPIVVEEAATALVGSMLDEAALAKAVAAAEAAAQPIDDVRGTVAFRRHTAGVLVRRAALAAASRARDGVPDSPPENWEK